MASRVISTIGLDKRVKALERRIDNLEQTVVSFKDVINRMQDENAELRKSNSALLENQKRLVKGMPHDMEKLSKDVRAKFMEKAGEQKETPLGMLYEMIEEEKAVKISDAARIFSVPEPRIEEWARKLEELGIIKITENGKEIRLRE